MYHFAYFNGPSKYLLFLLDTDADSIPEVVRLCSRKLVGEVHGIDNFM